jgi:hypothetical protein
VSPSEALWKVFQRITRWPPLCTYTTPINGPSPYTTLPDATRLTRIEVKPSAIDDVIEAFGDSAVPLLAETPGFRSALLFADPASGQLISHTVWQDPRARAASPSVAAVIRADLLEGANCVIRGVEDYSLVFSSARRA